MKDYIFQIFVLMVSVNVATTRNFVNDELSQNDVNKLEKLIEALQAEDSMNKHEEKGLGHLHHYDNIDEHDHTNIQTLNLVFKHNNIGRKPIARTGLTDDHSSLAKGRCLLGRCGCNGAARCGCGRSGDLCDENNNHAYDDVAQLFKNYNNADDDIVINGYKYRVNGQDRKHRTDSDVITEKKLDNHGNKYNQEDIIMRDILKSKCKPDKCKVYDFDIWKDVYNKNSDDDIVEFLDELENALAGGNDVEDNKSYEYDDDEDDERLYLRCCKKCGSKKSYRTNGGGWNGNNDDDKSFLRCCKKCGTSKYFRTRNGESNGDSVEDDHAYLRCCKQCGSSNYFRTNGGGPRSDKYQIAYLRCYKSCARTDDQDPKDDVRAAKIYQINDDLDAIVIDVSDIDNILKVLNNGNNYDNGNSIRDYIRAANSQLVPKYIADSQVKSKSRLLPLTLHQKMKLKNKKKQLLRRSQSPDVEKYGLPFELDVQGLGQVNP